MKQVLFAVIFVSLCSCQGLRVETSSISARPKNQYGKVLVLDSKADLPSSAILIGNCYVGDKGLTATKKCTYPACLDKTLSEARSIGGNAILIKEHLTPGSDQRGSTCHSLMSDIYYIPDNE